MILAQSSPRCAFSITYDTGNIFETGKVIARIKNTAAEVLILPESFSFCNLYIAKVELWNNEKGQYEHWKSQKKDIDCFANREKTQKLKSGKSTSFILNLKSDLDMMLFGGFFENSKELKYRILLHFPVYGKACSNEVSENSEWIYVN
ncbi:MULTISPECIES: hypothetical protein [Chryseobacterium]|uniref:hypothetical protein n=1 Tax=Chryseobacterium sp. R2A-55 TaxID=2744445 RepID=UPI001F4089BF|nr:hypothetical protein [Chryseobacterium sp. R2A-55]